MSADSPPPGFDWDPVKYHSNIVDHEGVTFDDGALAFENDHYFDYSAE
ncbi:hypothetical protein [Beijerinckia sp. L45]|nr:hypothetical protein [Beijerinckia sp. L45]